ncbi:MAG: hypothetical protein ABIY51_02685 [Ferruginibacter sp.]
MKQFLLSATISCLFSFNSLAAIYSTPGSGVDWNLDDLVANSGGFMTNGSSFYQVNDTIRISATDILRITSDATVKFVFNSSIIVQGKIIIDPPTGVLFTAVNPVTGFLGMRLDNSLGSIIRKLTLEYAVSLNLSDSSPLVDSCIFQYNNNNASTSFGNGSIALFRSKAVITNCSFLNNKRAAIQGGSNINNAPKISNCLFLGNNTTNQNVPQINLGATSVAGEDTVRIINNQILRASTNSGGIGFLPIGNVYVVISGNVIKNNRYGITLSGGSNINSVISYNQVDSNNTQNNPALGGSGIAFSGGSATSHQNSNVTNNLFRWNLWGITIQNGSKPNLGDLTNLSPDDDGNNIFINNTNATTPGIDLYNNSAENIMAQNNYWGTNDPVEIENKIFHQQDNASLGLVNYSLYVVPVNLQSFKGTFVNNAIKLSWQTVSEINNAYFELEKSIDGQHFLSLSTVNASGLNGAAYQFNDNDINAAALYYYRLKMVDKDGRYIYSAVIRIYIKNKENNVQVFPTILTGVYHVTASIQSTTNQIIQISLLDASGRILFKSLLPVTTGAGLFNINLPAHLPKGTVFLHLNSGSIEQVISLVNY